jgi:hypothetical protein
VAKAADGGGASLQRTNAQVIGNDPAVWIAAAPSPGRALPGMSSVSFFIAGPSHQVVLAGPLPLFPSRCQPSRPPLGLQWYFRNQPIDGATNSVLTLSSVQPEQAGPYCAIAFDELGAQSSSVAYLGVRTPVTITRQPASRSVFPLTNVIFEVLAASGSPISYQWNRNGMNLAGATNNTYAIPSVLPVHAGTYAVSVTDDAGTIQSATAVLDVVAHPVFTLQTDESERHCAHQRYEHQPGGRGHQQHSGALSMGVVWNESARGHQCLAQFSNATVSANGPYQVAAADNYGAVTSSNALLTILNRPVITLQPSASRCPRAGPPPSLWTAVGSEPLGFRWRQGGLTFTNGIILTRAGSVFAHAHQREAGRFQYL